jgi:hypothetical protein
LALPLRLVLTLAGIGLTLLGSLSVTSFWLRPAQTAHRTLPA